MGRKALHTQDEVFAAADRMAAAGADVTASALLATLGGGSLTTIYKHLEAWSAAHKDQPRPVMIAMPEAVRAAFAQAWQAAALEAGKEVAATREKADAEVQAMTKRFEEALANIERLETEANDEAAKSEAMSDQLAAQDHALRELQTQAAAWTAMIEQMRQQIAALKTERETAQKAASAAREDAARLQGQIEVLNAQQAEWLKTVVAADPNAVKRQNRAGE